MGRTLEIIHGGKQNLFLSGRARAILRLLSERRGSSSLSRFVEWLLDDAARKAKLTEADIQSTVTQLLLAKEGKAKP